MCDAHLVIATWNIGGKNAPAKTKRYYPQIVKTIVATMTNGNGKCVPQVLALQELNIELKNSITPKLPSHLELVVFDSRVSLTTTYSANGTPSNTVYDTGIIINTSMVEVVRSETAFRSSGVLLTQDGVNTFALLSVHIPGSPNTDMYKNYLKKTLFPLVDRLTRDVPVPVFIVGDFNRDFSVPDYQKKRLNTGAKIGNVFEVASIKAELTKQGFNLVTTPEFFEDAITSYHDLYNKIKLTPESAYEHLDWLFIRPTAQQNYSAEEISSNPEMKITNGEYPNSSWPSDHALVVFELRVYVQPTLSATAKPYVPPGANSTLKANAKSFMPARARANSLDKSGSPTGVANLLPYSGGKKHTKTKRKTKTKSKTKSKTKNKN